MNKYLALFQGKKWIVESDTLYGAKKKVVSEQKIPLSKIRLLSIKLVEQNGQEVVHTPDF